MDIKEKYEVKIRKILAKHPRKFTSSSIFNLFEFVRVQIFSPSIIDFLKIIVHVISLNEQFLSDSYFKINVRFELEPFENAHQY